MAKLIYLCTQKAACSEFLSTIESSTTYPLEANIIPSH